VALSFLSEKVLLLSTISLLPKISAQNKTWIMKDQKPSTELLRFTTAGSVDDGKSTLIGRMLYDSKAIFQDQYDAIAETTARRGEEGVNLALLTDGLRAEREQGITIDVAYRYFATPKRKFIIADTPGHVQYTRNMVTGASTANVALILIDARNGVVEQTRRHAIIASLLQIPHLLICVNKMDLVDYKEEVYKEIQADFENFASKLDVYDIHFIPISALKGDNVVTRSENMPWYGGTTLIYYLENVHIGSDHNFIDVRFPVQYVLRPNTDEFHDYRGYAGRIAGGVMKKGDKVMLLPSGFTSTIKKIDTFDGELEEAFPPSSVSILLEDDYDLSRGDMIVRENNQPEVTQDVDLMICWFSEQPIRSRGKYIIMHTTNQARCIIKEIRYKMNVNTLHRDLEDKEIGMNDIARISIRSTKPLFVDPYRKNRITGSVILIDEGTYNTVAAGMVI
jgi:sulfate adenylyltransferase subunit 1